MTTSSRTTSNKTALRASLKKEDESLADRLVAADVPVVDTTMTDADEVDPPAAATTTAPRTRRTAAAPGAAAKAPVARTASRRSPASQAAAEPAAAPKAMPARSKAASAKETAKESAADELGTVDLIEKMAKQKRDKLVSYSVKLLKSEEAAIEALREELSRAAGWATTKSDILRAGVRAFAEQKLEQMQALLGSLAVPAKAAEASKGKKGKKDKKGKKKR